MSPYKTAPTPPWPTSQETICPYSIVHGSSSLHHLSPKHPVQLLTESQSLGKISEIRVQPSDTPELSLDTATKGPSPSSFNSIRAQRGSCCSSRSSDEKIKRQESKTRQGREFLKSPKGQRLIPKIRVKCILEVFSPKCFTLHCIHQILNVYL